MEISSIAPSPVMQSQPSKGLVSSDFQTFLHMLTVQMQNQDPMNPVSSEDFATQLATFSGVEQQVRTNDLLASLVERTTTGGLTELASWVGRDVRAVAPTYFEGTPITVFPDPPVYADNVELVALDSAGKEVSRDAIPVSDVPLLWTGYDTDGVPYPADNYSFFIISRSNGEVIETEQVATYARVTEARIERGENKLVLEGGTVISAADVTALRGLNG